MNLADHFVANPNAPEVKVCGTGIKMTVFLLGRCGEGSLTATAQQEHCHLDACAADLHLRCVGVSHKVISKIHAHIE